MGGDGPQTLGLISTSLTSSENMGSAPIGDHSSVRDTHALINPGAYFCLYLQPNTFAVPLILNKFSNWALRDFQVGGIECLPHLTEENVNTNRQRAYFRAHDLWCCTFYCPHGNGWLSGCSAQKSEAGVGFTDPHSHKTIIIMIKKKI